LVGPDGVRVVLDNARENGRAARLGIRVRRRRGNLAAQPGPGRLREEPVRLVEVARLGVCRRICD
jgi:hypothetical protein